MSSDKRGNLLDHTVAEVEASAFARAYALECTDQGDGELDSKYQGLRRRLYKLRTVRDTELELLTNAKGTTEVAGLWFERRVLADRNLVGMAVNAYATFLTAALGEVHPRDHEALNNLFAVSYELFQARTFQPLLDQFSFLTKDGVGAAIEVFLGRREEASQTIMNRGAMVVTRLDRTGRLFVGVATQSAAFDLASMLFSHVSFRKGDRSGVVGWKTVEVETTPFGRRYGLDLERASPPKGHIARRHFGFQRIPSSARVELLLESARGMVGVLLRIEQEWIEKSEKNYFVALEVIAAFVAEGLGDVPDARTKMEIAQLFSCSKDDEDLFKVVHGSLPFVLKGNTGDAIAVFTGEAESAIARLDEGRCAVVLHDNEDGWIDCLFYLTEMADAIGVPAVP
jgi:hypothetical protein